MLQCARRPTSPDSVLGYESCHWSCRSLDRPWLMVSWPPSLRNHPLLTPCRPDHCDGTYDQFCDQARQYTNISAIIASYGKNDLLDYMNTYWKDYAGNDETFWEHEWGKHGTCISTLDPKCYTDYTGQEEVVDFFQKTVDLFKGLDSYQVRCSVVRGLMHYTDSHLVPRSCRHLSLD